MPWLCLERCNDTEANINSQIDALARSNGVYSAASFEDYNLGANSTLVKNDLSQVAKPIKALGLTTWAMVSSYPYPPEFISWMRDVFKSPQPFIDACLEAARKEQLTGYNIDWEPTTPNSVTSVDAQAYASFLQTFSEAMHKNGFKVSVDVATWSPIWDIPAIAKTDVDYIMTMGTYTANTTTFLKQLDSMVAQIPLTKLVVGLECDENDVGKLSKQDLDTRFAAIKTSGAQGIALWRMPVPQDWIPYIQDFALF